MAHRHKNRHRSRRHTHAIKPEYLSLQNAKQTSLAYFASAASAPLPALDVEDQDPLLLPDAHNVGAIG